MCILLLLLPGPAEAQAERSSIAERIAKAQPGETLSIPAGQYEGSLVIDKPLHLIGAGQVILSHSGSEPSITILSDGVQVENLEVHHTDSQSPAILVKGSHIRLSQLRIVTQSTGIRLDGARHNTLTHITVEGDPQLPIARRQHGIDLWQADRNVITHSRMQHVQDGIYIENSAENRVTDNTVSHSRYGYHLMFTRQTRLENNLSHNNVSGMMVMGTMGTVVQHNRLTDNRENVQSLGLLLFDVQKAHVADNQILRNRVGILIEDARDNELAHNLVQGNYIGLRFLQATDNHLHHNAFVANVVQGQAEESRNNRIRHNYWGDHTGLDLTGEGFSSLPYRVDPFFLQITDAYPPFQLFFHSPGLIFLEQLIHTPLEQQFTDQAPLLASPLAAPDEAPAQQWAVLLLCVAFLSFSSWIMYLGGRVQ